MTPSKARLRNPQMAHNGGINDPALTNGKCRIRIRDDTNLSLSGLRWASVIVHPPGEPRITLITFMVVGSSATHRGRCHSAGRGTCLGFVLGGAVVSNICMRKSAEDSALASSRDEGTPSYPCSMCNKMKNLESLHKTPKRSSQDVYEPAEYCPQYILSVSDATAVPLVLGMIPYVRGSEECSNTKDVHTTYVGDVLHGGLTELDLPRRDGFRKASAPVAKPSFDTDSAKLSTYKQSFSCFLGCSHR